MSILKFLTDEDVLDTWYSSGLLPFSIFGWPEVVSSKFCTTLLNISISALPSLSLSFSLSLSQPTDTGSELLLS